MQLTLIAPDGLPLTSASSGLPLGRFDCTRLPAGSVITSIRRNLGLTPSQQTGLETRYDLPAASHPLLQLRPLAIEVGLSSARILPAEQWCLSLDEARALAEPLALWLAEDGITLHVPDSYRWYLERPTPIADCFASFDETAPSVSAQQITGPEAAHWRRRLTELQMLLAQHPLNRQREARQQPVINLLWAQTGVACSSPLPMEHVWSLHPWLQALPAPVIHHRLPAAFEELTNQTDRHLVILPPIPAEEGHAALREHWLKPALRARQQGKLASLTLEWPGSPCTYRFTLGRFHRFRFWKSAVFHD